MEKLLVLIEENRGAKMLGRTHGQPASPTTMGKELAVFGYRLKRNLEELVSIKIDGKVSGAVGSYNSFFSAFPDFDWISFSKKGDVLSFGSLARYSLSKATKLAEFVFFFKK